MSWDAARYDSYRASDNTYRPFSGPRRQRIYPVV
ncbi:BA14K family protein [Rhizobium sp. WYJ-E13]|nr:BA14K family protein [Rhizobium sp. WYJ-E13]